MKIAIDGPSGAGKSTISKKVSELMGFVYIDTGAMYRAVGLKALYIGIDTKDEDALSSLLKDLVLDIKHEQGSQHIYLDGEDVSSLIRTPEVSMAASDVSAIPSVREAMVYLQRNLAKNHNVVMDGRDIGTCVLPDAEVKIFLTASIEARAERRFKELKEKGMDISFDDVKSDMERRDYNDSTRAASPLKIAEGAAVIDTSGMTLEESVKAVIDEIKKHY